MAEQAVSQPKGDVRKQARELLIKAKVYRFFAMAFVAVGMVVFVRLYFQHIDGRLAEALGDFKTIFIVLVPFLPAAVLSILAARTNGKFQNLVRGQSAENAVPSTQKQGK